ncbi:MAG: helix-hairpin-helix domain-containing protein [Erysipelotrichaceae bacterium]|nr:helix-hairpin-helix domain-containing protein [Erysipelotrichaceae bacterium]
MFKTIIIVVAVTVVCLIALAVVDRVTTDINNPTPATITRSSEKQGLEITLEGEVLHPGVYLVPLMSTLGDALSAAGGTTSNADPKAYDTTLRLEDGWECYIAPLYDNSNTCSADPIVKACINTATAEKLKGLSCFTSTVADKIVSYRSEQGLFHRLEEIKNVSGVGPATWEKCKNYITLKD